MSIFVCPLCRPPLSVPLPYTQHRAPAARAYVAVYPSLTWRAVADTPGLSSSSLATVVWKALEMAHCRRRAEREGFRECNTGANGQGKRARRRGHQAPSQASVHAALCGPLCNCAAASGPNVGLARVSPERMVTLQVTGPAALEPLPGAGPGSGRHADGQAGKQLHALRWCRRPRFYRQQAVSKMALWPAAAAPTTLFSKPLDAQPV